MSSASEKKQKSFRDVAGSEEHANLTGEFVPFFAEAHDAAFAGLAADPRPSESEFGLPDQFWSWLDADSGLKSQFDAMIESRVSDRVAKQFEANRPALEAEARRSGHQEGYEAGMKSAGKALESLENVVQAILREKSQLLHGHEGAWLRSMRHLLERFLVKNGVDVSGRLEAWISEGLTQFEHAGQVKVRLSTVDYEAFSMAGGFSRGRTWELVEDPTLPPGQIHCECGDGGFVFDSERELKKLDDMIERQLAERKATPE